MAIEPEPVPDGVAPNGKPYESVWDFPRPPRLESVPWRIRVVHGGRTIVDAPRALRILETSQPPAYYVDEAFIDTETLELIDGGGSYCEWKGVAGYADVIVGSDRASGAAWTYRSPSDRYAEIDGTWAFYPQRVDECWVDDEQVAPNPGAFYGGWITNNVKGPFKGAPGTLHW